MDIEIEAKFLDINRNDLRDRLKQAGFHCVQPDCLMRRIVFNTPHSGGDSWARVRDEGHAITVSFKRTHDLSRVDGTEEIVIKVDDFDAACRLLDALGQIRKSYQETRREIWQRGAVEVVLDEWPALRPFAEMEASSEAELRAAAAELDFDWQYALFGAVGAVYERIGIPSDIINKAPRLTFDNIEEILALRTTSRSPR